MPNGTYGFDDDVPEQPKNSTTSYPHGNPKYMSSVMDNEGLEISPGGHFAHHMPSIKDADADSQYTFIRTTPEHFTRDINTPSFKNDPLLSAERAEDAATRDTMTRGLDGLSKVPVFSGSTTNVNPTGDRNVADIVTNGLWNHEKSLNNGKEPRISPLLPFTRASSDNPNIAQASNFYFYNRTKIPVADLEWRKGFRHIFITRPECYIMSSSNGQLRLSEQCEHDREFSSIYNQFPHIAKVLSPSYITGDSDNFNYLLSNRVMGIASGGINMSHDESVQKSIEGYTVQPAKLMTSNQGATIDLTFRDTKNMDVFNCLRGWMLYQYKTYKGSLAPSYNKYEYSNSYDLGADGMSITKSNNTTWQYMMHPYDRALDYCATIFDIITNETGTKILYWCKYYGIYPVSITPTLTNSNGGALQQEMSLSCQFKYQRKMEMNEQTFIEFNFNAGLVNPDGSYKLAANNSASFLYNEGQKSNDVSKPSSTYMGAAGMFVSTPYIIINEQTSPINKNMKKRTPYLQFMPLPETTSDGYDYHVMNNFIENRETVLQYATAYGTAPNSSTVARNYYEGYEQAVRNRTVARKSTT